MHQNGTETFFIRPRRSINNNHGWIGPFYENPTNVFDPKKTKSLKIKSMPSRKVSLKIKNSGSKNINKTNSPKMSWNGYLKENVRQYFEKSTLHGLRYVGDSSLSIFERIFWITSFLGAVACSAYFITIIYERWRINPVIISLNPRAIPLSNIPFPAITICNMNQASKFEAQHINVSGTDIEKSILDDFCDSNNTIYSNISTNDNSNSYASWDSLKKFMIKVGQSCSEMIKVCKWNLEETDCNLIFKRTLTDEGLCCTFNTLPKKYIFKNYKDMFETDDSICNDTVVDWSPEKGFPDKTPSDAIPRRPIGPGAHLGLSLVLDANIDNYFCSSTSSIGFKALMHNPAETPKMADFGFFLPPSRETRINIIPKISDATKTIQSVSVDKRQCFFTSERTMAYYRSYTQRNCKLECQANFTLQRCGCVPYFLPMNETTRICGKKQERCSNEAKAYMEIPTNYLGNSTDCKCLPGCFEISYGKSHSFSDFYPSVKIKDTFLKNTDPEYFRKNMALIHFFFVDGQFTKYTKSEIYGFTEFLSNTGGLLGLFCGFSFLSAVEIGYYLTIKMFCSYRQKFRNQQRNNIPFTK